MHVLISGAGIAGSLLAWYLARLDIKVTILERSKAQLGQGQNIDISSNAAIILKRMGLLDEVRRLNTTEKGTAFLAQNAKVIGEFPVSKDGPSPTAEFEILRGDLAMIFYNAIKDHPNVDFRFETSVKELLANDEDTGVKVKFTDGKVYNFDMAFAADGQWSELRKLTFPADEITVIDKGAYFSYWTISRQPQDTEWWYVYWGLKARMVSIRPDPHGTMRANLSKMPLNKEENELWTKTIRLDKQSQKDLVKQTFADVGWETPRFLKEIDDSPDFYLQAVKQIKMKKWWKGRIVCVGDAAYAPTPLTGMGTSLAIMGAYVLAGELSKLQPGDLPSKAFEAYDKTYHAYTEKVQSLPSFVPGIAHPASKWHLWALQTAIATAATIFKIPFIARAVGGKSQDDNNGGFPLPEYSTLQPVWDK